MLSAAELSLGEHVTHLVKLVGWIVTVFLVVAALIDGLKLRVPNWLTFSMVLSGWMAGGLLFGWEGLGASLLGTAVGLGLLLPLYAIGGMGAGDVKLLAGVGAWIGAAGTVWGFVFSALIGGVLAFVIASLKKGFWQHQRELLALFTEVITLRNPAVLAAQAAERKPHAVLLPYGIPIAIGCIGYFLIQGMLV